MSTLNDRFSPHGLICNFIFMGLGAYSKRGHVISANNVIKKNLSVKSQFCEISVAEIKRKENKIFSFSY